MMLSAFNLHAAHRCWLAIGLWLAAVPASAIDAGHDSQVPGHAQAEALGDGKVDRQSSFVLMPIPLSNPSLGSGLVLSAVMFYRPHGSERPWMSGAGALWTDNGSRGAGVFQKAYLRDDTYRLTAGVGRADFNLRFYGIGNAQGKNDRAIKFNQQADVIYAELLRKVAANQYAGLVLWQMDSRVSPRFDRAAPDSVALPSLDLETRLLGPGLSYEFDTRDNEQWPSRGSYASANLRWSLDAFGADREYGQIKVHYNHYQPMGQRGVLAWRASACGTSRHAPFFQLCQFGANSDLRGYETGQYRDRTLLAAQGEYRLQFSPRWGAVAFAGVGGVGHDLDDYRMDELLPAAGVGLRFKASLAYDVNVRVDYARGKDSDGLYFAIGEAF